MAKRRGDNRIALSIFLIFIAAAVIYWAYSIFIVNDVFLDPPENLIKDYSFENHNNTYWGFGNINSSFTSATAHSGTYSLAILGSGFSWQQSPELVNAQGKIFKVSFWARANTVGNIAKMTVLEDWSQRVEIPINVQTANQWTEYSGNFIIKSNNPHKISFVTNSNSSLTQIVYFDDLILTYSSPVNVPGTNYYLTQTAVPQYNTEIIAGISSGNSVCMILA